MHKQPPITDPALVTIGLESPKLKPPTAPDSIGSGATATLRAAMARFSWGDSHHARRADVDLILATISDAPVTETAFAHTSAWLAERSVPHDAVELASAIPTAVLQELLGIDEPSLQAEVNAIAAVIGRGEAATTASDSAATVVQQRVSEAGHDQVAATSLLYQNYDATKGQTLLELHATLTGTTHRPTFVTAREALEPVSVGDTNYGTGDLVHLNLTTADLDFGAGPHACPGRAVAEAIVAGIVRAVADAGLTVDESSVVCNDNGQPQVLRLS